MYAVIMVHTFDADTPTVLFEDYDKAKAYLHWLWKEYYNTEIAEGSLLDKEGCFHDDEYAKVTWTDNEATEFILTYTSEPDPEFKYVESEV
jgi:hypothetical protein